MNSNARREFEFDFSAMPRKVDFDFQAIRIRVYKNGDEHDPGKIITVTRREYKHWIIFLDALTRKLGTTTAIHKLYSITGTKVEHFTELEHNGEYVAVERGPFIDCNYGAYHAWTQTEKKWTSLVRVTEGKPIFLGSGDTMDLYLKKEGYGSVTGLPYPLDGLSRSPNISSMHSGMSRGKCGGSLECLNKVGKDMWNPDTNALSISNIPSSERKEKSLSKEHSMSVTKLPRLAGIEDESQKCSSQKLVLKSKEDDRLPPIRTEVVQILKETREDSMKRDDVRCPTRDYNLSKYVERKETEETKDVREYAPVEKPVLLWDGRKGTTYEKKEMMHEVIIKGSKPNIRPDMKNREWLLSFVRCQLHIVSHHFAHLQGFRILHETA
ncbi:Doublecortin [Dictyocaulus viviparus]|uniref:Doublecortin n=1 Tax=Dictyocaulus viviparus TaxID=29172 RepID=A0A0D8XFJ3_DICVI|nr:Doublecortin [Dictyocaulus viviparus]